MTVTIVAWQSFLQTFGSFFSSLAQLFAGAPYINVIAAIAGGMLPALLWLWFWLREDSKHPEPRMLIALAFLAGMVAVAVVVPIEQWVAQYITQQQALFAAWPFIEETCKFLAAALTVLWLSADDEPIDPLIYMVCAALGFAAAENTLFLLSPISGQTLLQTVITGDYRFVGATLLHVLASATVGTSLALSFNKPLKMKILFAIAGVILATCLHGAFNFFIMNEPQGEVVRAFTFVWIGLIGLLALFEFIKRIPARRTR